MKILIAEDDLTSRTLLAGVLRKEGHDVTETVNGSEALLAMQQTDAPKIAVLDWMMPEMDGLEVVRRIREVPTDRPPYLIMLTAKGGKGDIVVGLDAGADDYLVKPFHPGELRARIEVGRRIVDMQDALVKGREVMAHQAMHDPLTDLPNRRAILDRLHREIARIRRTGDVLAVGMCDIDYFKRINDTYGHQAGDDVLCGLARILRDSLREYDDVGRMGGEEFLVIAPIGSGADVVSVFERLRLRVSENKILSRSGLLSVTVSIGVVQRSNGSTLDDILEAADAALYRAKQQGRNRVVLAAD